MSEPEIHLPAQREEQPQPPPQPPPGAPYWDYADLALFAVAFVPSLVTAGMLVGVIFPFLGLGRFGNAAPLLAAQFLAYAIWFVFLFGLLKTRYRSPFWTGLGFVRWGERLFERLLAGVGLALAVGLAGALLRTPDLDTPMKALVSDRTSVLLVGLAASTIGPVCEELAFRGFLQPLLSRSLGAWPGILLAALPFSLLHGQQYAWSWRHILLVTLAGVSFGWMRHRTGSTAAASVMHCAYNATYFAAMLVSGKDLPSQW
jgi:membrane protease YdiL (CAAX protease family)